jgi:hypothetical protein
MNFNDYTQVVQAYSSDYTSIDPVIVVQMDDPAPVPDPTFQNFVSPLEWIKLTLDHNLQQYSSEMISMTPASVKRLKFPGRSVLETVKTTTSWKIGRFRC